MIYCCMEHVELAIDVIVDDFEVAPLLKQLTEGELSTTCEYCGNKAIYLVTSG